MSYKPSKNIFLLSVVSFLNDFSSEMILSVFPAFFVSVLKTGAGALGIVEGIADGASNIIKIYFGKISDRIQKRKPLILVGYSLSVLTRPAYLLVSQIFGVAGLRLLDRVGKGMRDAPRDSLLSLSTKKEELGRAFGFHRMFDTLGGILGPFAVYVILSLYPGAFDLVFTSSFIIGIFAVIAIFFIKDIAGEIKNKNISLGSLSQFSAGFKRYLFSLFFLSLGSIPVAVLLLKTQNLGLTLASIPLFYMVYNFSYAGFSFYAGKISDKFGHKKTIGLGNLFLIIGYVLLFFAQDKEFLFATFLFLGLYPAFTDGVARALASEISPEENRGGALGLVNAVSGFGLLFSGIFGGYMWQNFGVGSAVFVASFFVILGLTILLSIKESHHVRMSE